MNAAAHWHEKICTLRRFRNRHGYAPHKPLFLLAFFDFVEHGMASNGTFELTPELVSRFSDYADVVAHRRAQPVRVGYPFFHLRREGFWRMLDKAGRPTDKPRQARYAEFDQEFLAVARDPMFRRRARHLLIASYFEPEDRTALYALCGLQPPDSGSREPSAA